MRVSSSASSLGLNAYAKEWTTKMPGDGSDSPPPPPKRTICTYFTMGGCRHGDSCPYSHSLVVEAPEGVDASSGFFISGNVRNMTSPSLPAAKPSLPVCNGTSQEAAANHSRSNQRPVSPHRGATSSVKSPSSVSSSFSGQGLSLYSRSNSSNNLATLKLAVLHSSSAESSTATTTSTSVDSVSPTAAASNPQSRCNTPAQQLPQVGAPLPPNYLLPMSPTASGSLQPTSIRIGGTDARRLSELNTRPPHSPGTPVLGPSQPLITVGSQPIVGHRLTSPSHAATPLTAPAVHPHHNPLYSVQPQPQPTAQIYQPQPQQMLPQVPQPQPQQPVHLPSPAQQPVHHTAPVQQIPLNLQLLQQQAQQQGYTITTVNGQLTLQPQSTTSFASPQQYVPRQPAVTGSSPTGTSLGYQTVRPAATQPTITVGSQTIVGHRVASPHYPAGPPVAPQQPVFHQPHHNSLYTPPQPQPHATQIYQPQPPQPPQQQVHLQHHNPPHQQQQHPYPPQGVALPSQQWQPNPHPSIQVPQQQQIPVVYPNPNGAVWGSRIN